MKVQLSRRKLEKAVETHKADWSGEMEQPIYFQKIGSNHIMQIAAVFYVWDGGEGWVRLGSPEADALAAVQADEEAAQVEQVISG